MNFKFRVKEYKNGGIIEHEVTLDVVDKLTAFKVINEMYPYNDGFTHSLIFNDEVCG